MYILRIYWHILVVSLLCLTVLTATAIQKPTNIEANRYLLYNNTASMANQQFNVSFSKAFNSTPLFVYGINDYKLGDQFAFQNFQSLTSSLTQTMFSISVTSVGSTNVRTFSISYFAAQPQNSFLSNFQNVTNGVNISTFSTSSYRYYQVYVGVNFTTASTYAFPLLTGYHITSSNYFYVNVTASVVSTVNYKYKIETASDCSLLRVTFFVLFCQRTEMDSSSYYYEGGINLVESYNPSSLSNFTYAVDKYNQTVFLLGLRGFSGFTSLTGCFWGWSIGSVNNDIASLTIYQRQLQYIQFSFFKIGKYVVTADDKTEAEEGGGNYIPIIAGLIAGIVITTVAIVSLLKWYWKRAILNLPENDDFRTMPSISL